MCYVLLLLLLLLLYYHYYYLFNKLPVHYCCYGYYYCFRCCGDPATRARHNAFFPLDFLDPTARWVHRGCTSGVPGCTNLSATIWEPPLALPLLLPPMAILPPMPILPIMPHYCLSSYTARLLPHTARLGPRHEHMPTACCLRPASCTTRLGPRHEHMPTTTCFACL